MDLTIKTVINYENSYRLPDYETLKMISKKLHIDPIQLIGSGKK